MDQSAQPKEDEKFLPKEPLDLPKPHEMLPSSREDVGSSTHDVHTLLSWHAPGRPFRARSSAYYINMLLILLPLEVIFFLFGQYMLMLVALALAFFYYALTTVPPHDFRYKISSEGLTIEDYFFLWQELYDFYFKHIDGNECIIIRTKAYLPGELTINLGDIHKEQVKTALLPYLPFREYVKPTLVEKWSEKLRKTFPLERSPHGSST
ncbi:MAG: hypothetical protein HYV40_02390 [Candidatus Levybacteria bacterium]|nr:hypothetical protein [Candidatus Levybacteria bacterium]